MGHSYYINENLFGSNPDILRELALELYPDSFEVSTIEDIENMMYNNPNKRRIKVFAIFPPDENTLSNTEYAVQCYSYKNIYYVNKDN